MTVAVAQRLCAVARPDAPGDAIGLPLGACRWVPAAGCLPLGALRRRPGAPTVTWASEDGVCIPLARSSSGMPYQAYHEVMSDRIGELQTRTLTVTEAGPESPLALGHYGFIEMYCNELGCDCRRVMLHIKLRGNPSPVAVIAWGWESSDFYQRWLGEDDTLTLEQLKGPVLNLGSPRGKGAHALLDVVTRLLSWDTEYIESLKEHYREFRAAIRREHFVSTGARGIDVDGYSGQPSESGGSPTEQSVIDTLEEGGIDTSRDKSLPAVGLDLTAEGQLRPPGEAVAVTDGKRVVSVRLRAVSDLFVGTRQPPSFGARPPPAYVPFFLALERAAYEYCAATDERVRDKEFEQAYHDLRRRPDGRGEHPVVLHIQAAARLYLSLRDISQAEYEGVMRRLSRSARTFAMGYSSTHYFDAALAPTFSRGP